MKRALSYTVPPDADVTYSSGEEVLVWSERVVSGRIGEWNGPFKVSAWDTEKSLIYVHAVKIGSLVLSMSLKSNHTCHPKYFRIRLSPRSHPDSPITLPLQFFQILRVSDSSASSKKIHKSVIEEVQGLSNRRTFDVVNMSDIPPDFIVLPGTHLF